MHQAKKYPLTKTLLSLLVIIPSVFSALFLIILLLVYGVRAITTPVLLFLLIIVFGLMLSLIFYGLTNRLVTTQSGIEYYFFYNFHIFFPWDNVTRVYAEPFGNVFLIAQPQSSLKAQRIQLDAYIDDWHNSEFIQDLRGYAPQLLIPNDIFTKKKIYFPYRTGSLLLYFVACMIFIPVPSLLIPNEITQPVQFALGFAMSGFFGGIFGGMAELLKYSAWVNSHPDEREIKKIVRLLYLTPFSAWATAFFLDIIFHALTGYEIRSNLNSLALLIGFMQPTMLQWLYSKFTNRA